MMIVCHPHAQKVIDIHLFDDVEVHTYMFAGDTQDFFGFVLECLSRHGANLQDVTHMGVVMQEGTFTATRILSVLANTLAYTMGIAVRSIPLASAIDIQGLRTCMTEPVFQEGYVLPLYSGLPTIGGQTSAP